MIEWVLIIWVSICGSGSCDIEGPKEIGTYRSITDCEAAAYATINNKLGDKRGGVTATCTPRDK